MKYSKSKNIICFSKSELFNLFRTAKEKELIKEIDNRDLTFNDLINDFEKRKTIAETIGRRTVEDRDEHEIFSALFNIVDYYDKDSEICFEMKYTFNPNRNKITSIKKLNKFREGSLSDFIIKSKKNLRYFQMKRFRGKLDTHEIFNFLKKKIEHYANNLGDMNLLVILQCLDKDISVVDFSKIHSMIKNLYLSFNGHILIFYNENNKFFVINTVYPILGTTRISWQSVVSTKMIDLDKK